MLCGKNIFESTYLCITTPQFTINTIHGYREGARKRLSHVTIILQYGILPDDLQILRGARTGLSLGGLSHVSVPCLPHQQAWVNEQAKLVDEHNSALKAGAGELSQRLEPSLDKHFR